MNCLRIGLTVLILLQTISFARGQPTPGTPLWFYDAGQLIITSPALGYDGTVYIAGGSGLLAITNSGAIASNKWTFATTGQARASAAVEVDGTVYCAAGSLYALNQDGTEKWRFGAGAGIGAPAVALDGTTFFVGTYGNLFAVATQGAQRWALPIGTDTALTSPIIGQDGTIYVPSPNVGLFYAVRPEGTIKWQSALGDRWDSLAIGADGTIYVSGGASVLNAVAPNGTNLWSSTGTSSFLGSAPVIGKNGTIYLTGILPDNPTFGWWHVVLYALSPSGSLQWRFVPAAWGARYQPAPFTYIPGSPAVDSGGTVHFAGFNTLYAIAPSGQQQWTFSVGESYTNKLNDPANYSYSSPAIGPDGTIYVTFGSRLYAIAGTNGPADSPWPMYRQNARRTGKVEKPALRQPQKRSDANFQFQLYGQLGQTFTVEASTNFNTWTSVTSIVANTLPMDVVDLSASNHPSRFYRASSPP